MRGIGLATARGAATDAVAASGTIHRPRKTAHCPYQGTASLLTQRRERTCQIARAGTQLDPLRMRQEAPVKEAYLCPGITVSNDTRMAAPWLNEDTFWQVNRGSGSLRRGCGG
jgi:hypothetical protein